MYDNLCTLSTVLLVPPLVYDLLVLCLLEIELLSGRRQRLTDTPQPRSEHVCNKLLHIMNKFGIPAYTL